MVRPVILSLLFAFTISPLLGFTPDPFQRPIIQEVQALHNKAENGDKDATKRLVKKLEKLTRENPKDYLLLCYLGSAYTLASRDAFPGPKKYDFLKKGLKTMDQAVSSAPDDIAVRFIRAVNNFHLPAFINRRDNARRDFQTLIKAIREKPHGLNNETIQAIHYYAGMSCKQLKLYKQASQIWTEGLVLDETSSLATRMSTELSKLKM